MQKVHIRHLWLWGAGFGFYGSALLLERIGALIRSTMPRPTDYVSQGLPVPSSVYWEHPLSRALYWLGNHHTRWTALWWLLLAASPFIMFYALQIGGSFFEKSDSSDDMPSEPLQRRLHVRNLLRVLVLSFLSLWLVGAWWWVYRAAELYLVRPISPRQEIWLGGIYFWLGNVFRREEILSPVYFAACGLVLFVLWQGALSPSRLCSAAARGLTAGLLSASVLFLLFPPGHRIVTQIMRQVGTSGERLWHAWAIGFCLVGTIGFVALGVATCLLTRPQWVRQAGGRPQGAMLLSAGTLLLIGVLQWGLYTQVVRKRWDFGKEFRPAVLGATEPRRSRSEGRTLIIIGRRYGVGLSPLMTLMEVENNQRTKETAWRYLRERNFRTCLSEAAFVHLHDCASLDWDSTASLEIDFANIEHCPTLPTPGLRGRRPTFVDLMLEKLNACPITPETRRYLDKLADPRVFHHPSPITARIVGDLYWKFGDRKKTLEWYRRAKVSPKDIKGIQTLPLLVRNGVVKGSLVVNGQPAAGWRVGVVPWNNRRTLLGPQVPFVQRFILAGVTTDAQGGFRIEHLPAGYYALVLAVSSRTVPPRWGVVVVKNPTGMIGIGAQTPQCDLGNVEIEVNKNAPPPQRSPEPPGGEGGTVVT